jgi:hypothetical protein
MKIKEKIPEEKSKGSFKDKRKICLADVGKIPTVSIKNKQYAIVVERHKHLLQSFPEARFNEEILHHDNDRVVVKVELYIGDTIYSVGHAEEFRNSSYINKTSALENASTSALGRCLAAFGLSGSEFASAEELVNAINNQGTTQDSIENKIEKMTTETKLNKLYSDWKNKMEQTEKKFQNKQQQIKTNGGQNVKQW